MAKLRSFSQVRSPPVPPYIILTDRADGTLWLLSHDVTGEHVAISDGVNLLDLSDYVVYPANSGPVVPDTPSNPIAQKSEHKRLLVRGGYLGYENVPDATEQGRVMTRRGLSLILRRIFVPDTWRAFDSGNPTHDDDTLGYIFEDLP